MDDLIYHVLGKLFFCAVFSQFHKPSPGHRHEKKGSFFTPNDGRLMALALPRLDLLIRGPQNKSNIHYIPGVGNCPILGILDITL
jgi:hypothetical protein